MPLQATDCFKGCSVLFHGWVRGAVQSIKKVLNTSRSMEQIMSERSAATH